jgi:hypothetical protein
MVGVHGYFVFVVYGPAIHFSLSSICVAFCILRALHVYTPGRVFFAVDLLLFTLGEIFSFYIHLGVFSLQ